MVRIPILVYPRHIHLSQKDAEILFGKNYTLTPKKALSQPGQFIAKEMLTLKWPKWTINNVAIFWPWRKRSQVEIFSSDTTILGIDAPVRISWDLRGSAGITLIGPAGEIQLSQGVIIPQKHLHITVAEAEDFWLANGQIIKVKIQAQDKPSDKIFLDDVVVRVRDSYILDCHITQEEGNAIGRAPWIWWEIITE